MGSKPATSQTCNTQSCTEYGGSRYRTHKWVWESSDGGSGPNGCYDYGSSGWSWPGGPSSSTHGSFREGMVINEWQYTTVPDSYRKTGAGGGLSTSYGCSGSTRETWDLQREMIQKWNGQLPTYMLGDDTNALFNMGQ